MEKVLINKDNSLMLKGVGILLMLVHHLFYSEWSQPLYDDITIHGVGVVNQLGVFCKLCVAVFIFVSGYGLAVSTPKDIKLKDFYWHRFKKLWLNYWYIWLIFVPISVFVFGRTFTDAYGNHAIAKAILEFFGFAKMFGVMGYNPTWWFYNCIIILYLIFPLLNKYLFKTPYLFVSIALTIILVRFVPGANVIADYLFVFLLGMFMSRMPLYWLEGTKIWHIIVAIIILSVWRLTNSSPKYIVDAFLCAGFAIFLYKVTIWKWLSKVLESLGKHSMNMFLTHTFIFYFWFTDYIYITRNPIIIFLSLLVSSYLISIVIEWTKKIVGFNKIA